MGTILWIAALCLIGCEPASSQGVPMAPPTEEFSAYWYGGEAELTRYQLSQARYGEMHDGEAVLIFVTEDFLTDKQVKFEGGAQREEVASVLKLNATRKFFTGIYPYSMMASIFTPVQGARTLKVTTTSQEWCGHTFSQLNLKRNQYRGRLHSYFEAEGDQAFTVGAALLEDELWTRIRLNPEALPTGDIELIPGTMFLRLSHRDFAVESATASLVPSHDSTLSAEPMLRYRVEYHDFARILEITFEQAFPHRIVAWEEHSPSNGRTGERLITRAVRTHTMNSAYWGQHDVADRGLRKQLGLDSANY